MTSTARLGTTSSTRYGKCDDGDYRETSDYRRGEQRISSLAEMIFILPSASVGGALRRHKSPGQRL
jgi:hypothetical protein